MTRRQTSLAAKLAGAAGAHRLAGKLSCGVERSIFEPSASDRATFVLIAGTIVKDQGAGLYTLLPLMESSCPVPRV
jgi:hypothetical protein